MIASKTPLLEFCGGSYHFDLVVLEWDTGSLFDSDGELNDLESHALSSDSLPSSLPKAPFNIGLHHAHELRGDVWAFERRDQLAIAVDGSAWLFARAGQADANIGVLGFAPSNFPRREIAFSRRAYFYPSRSEYSSLALGITCWSCARSRGKR